MTKPEQRRFTRIPFDATAVLTRGSRRWESTMMDVSLKGVLVARPENWDILPGEGLTLELEVEGHDVVITMRTVVAHVEADRVGLRCEHIDIDSITHLRRLVELNLGNEEQLQRELLALGRYV
jgi:PilZ domain